MRIEIEIPVEFESDYRGDKFNDFFSRVLCDIKDGTLCGNYEKETVEMFIKAFDESKTAYNVNNVVAGIRRCSGNGYRDIDGDYVPPMIETKEAIEIVQNGGW